MISRGFKRILNNISSILPFVILKKNAYMELIMARMGRPPEEIVKITQVADKAAEGLKISRTALASHLNETDNIRSWGLVNDLFNTILRVMESIGIKTRI